MGKFLQQPESKLGESTRINSAAEEMVKYMHFAEQACLTDPISGVPGFAELFAKIGPKDAAGHAQRELDLKPRLLRYPCSFLIYFEAFDQMPPP